MKVLVLDGYNVIHAIPELEKFLDVSLESARNALVRMCESVAASRGDFGRIDVVFDGRDEFTFLPDLRLGRVRIIFSGSDEKADGRILELIKEEKASFLIVSDDRDVYHGGRDHSADVMKTAEFYRRYVSKIKEARPAKPLPLSRETAQKITEEYKRHLGLGD